MYYYQIIEVMQHKKVKAVILAFTIIFISAVALLTSCGNNRGWSARERQEAHEMLREWREMVYLNDLTEEEFALFANNVTDLLQMEYPSWVEFIEMPMVGDSVEMVVITAIVTEIKASPDKLRHIFGYEELCNAGVLPVGMSHKHQQDFYKCLAEKVNNTFGSMQQFVWDAVYSKLDDMIIAQMMRHCAEPYWEN